MYKEINKILMNSKGELTFGIYKGKNINEVIRDNPDYVKWALQNVSFFKLRDKYKNQLGI